MAVSTFTCCVTSSEVFVSLPTLAHQTVTLYSFLCQSLATCNLHSVSMDLPILDVSYKWNYAVCHYLWACIYFKSIFFFMYVCSVHVCTCACGGLRLMLGISLDHSSVLLFLRWDLLLKLRAGQYSECC